MNKATSIYLDLVRFGAAFLVFIGHANDERLTNGSLSLLSGFGHDAVIVFFVLSGYVIAYVSDTKEHGVTDYTISRLARLYSVALPALALTIIFDCIGQHIDGSLYSGPHINDNPLLRFVTSIFFLNEIWFAHIRAFSDGPYWSLGYEFWYYVLFAAIFYFEGKKKWISISAISIFIGPKILLLFPIWITGVFVYRWTKRAHLNSAWGGVIYFGSFAAYFVYRELDIPTLIRSIMEEFYSGDSLNIILRQSQNFPRDYIVGILVAANFFSFSSVSKKVYPLLDCAERPIRFLASFTFTLYLLHYPLLYFYAALFKIDPTKNIHVYLLISATLLTIGLVGAVTEKKKHVFKKAFIYIKNIQR